MSAAHAHKLPAVCVRKLSAALRRQDDIVAAWLFGSAARGAMHAESDVDVGVLFTVKPGLDRHLEVMGLVMDAVRRDRVDLVILNDAHVVLRFEAVSGRLLVSRDDGERASFVSLTAREYEDEMAFMTRGYQMNAA